MFLHCQLGHSTRLIPNAYQLIFSLQVPAGILSSRGGAAATATAPTLPTSGGCEPTSIPTTVRARTNVAVNHLHYQRICRPDPRLLTLGPRESGRTRGSQKVTPCYPRRLHQPLTFWCRKILHSPCISCGHKIRTLRWDLSPCVRLLTARTEW